MKLKKFSAFLMMGIVCTEQIIAGSGASTPLQEEQERQPEAIRKTTQSSRADDIDKIAMVGLGIAALTIGVGAASYGLQHQKESSKIPCIDLRKFNNVRMIYNHLNLKIDEHHQSYMQQKIDNNLIYVMFDDYSNFDTENSINTWFQEDFFRRRIASCRLQKDGLFRVLLRENILKPENSRRFVSDTRDTFSYSRENFDVEAWRKEKNISNNFPSGNYKEKYSCPSYWSHNITKKSDDDSSSSEIDERPTSLKASPKDCPVIDLSSYQGVFLEAANIDLHPVYNKNFRKHLRDVIFKLQRDYHLSISCEKKVKIITGTGKSRPGPNYTLQNAVQELLKKEFFWRRIAYCREKEGLFIVFLRKNIKQ